MEHITVLKSESVAALNIKPNGLYVDATLGGGGHSELILSQLTGGHLYAFDQDEFAIEYAKNRLQSYTNITYIHKNFSHLKSELLKLGINKVDGILFDLGLSSFQIDDETRGFSYLKNHELDMRMDRSQSLTAKEVVNTYSLEALTDIFRTYGEEKNAFKIAREIIKRRPLETTFDLVAITDRINFDSKGHSAKRVFQALRIEVNHELDVLEQALTQSLELLNVGGRLVVITFHSLEDRIVKHFMKKHSVIDAPKSIDIRNLPQPPLKLITRKANLPTEDEVNENKRSHSAKLRVAEKQI
jgi:16S rRNA (cytosine1402-N4)-methyltransferase